MYSIDWWILVRLVHPIKRQVDWLPSIKEFNIERSVVFLCRNRHSAEVAWDVALSVRYNADLYNNCIIELSSNDGSSNILWRVYAYIFECKSSYVFTRCIENLCKNPAAIEIIRHEEYILNDINLIYKICQNPKIDELFDAVVDKFDSRCWHILCHNKNSYKRLVDYISRLDMRCWVSLCYSDNDKVKDIFKRCRCLTEEMLIILCSNTVLYEVAVEYIDIFNVACWQCICENPAAIGVIRENIKRIPNEVITGLFCNYNAIDMIKDMRLIDHQCFLNLCLNKNAGDLIEPILKKWKGTEMISKEAWFYLAETDAGIKLIDEYADDDILHDSNLWYIIAENNSCEWFVQKHFNLLKDWVALDNSFWELLLMNDFSSEFKVRILNEIDVAYDIRIDWQSFCEDPRNITWIKHNKDWLIERDLIYYVYANEAIYEDHYTKKDEETIQYILNLIL